MQSKTARWFWGFWHSVFYSSVSEATESSPARLAMTREWLLRLPAWGKKMRCCSRWRHGAEKVGVETKMCLFMPTGVLTLLRAAFAFCQERELKGHSQDMETSTSFWLPLYSISSCSSFFEVSFNGRWKRRLPTEVQLKKIAGSVSLRWIWRCQSAHSQLVFQSRGEGHVEFRVRAMTDGCRGTLMSAAAPSQGFTGCKQAVLSWDGTKDS